MIQDNRCSADSTTNAPECAECERLQSAINEAVWLLEEGQDAEALAILERSYDEGERSIPVDSHAAKS